MRSNLSGWEVDLTRWLKPFLDRLGHKARRRMCPLYVAGLIGPGDRKSVQPMAERLAPGDYDQLHHFVAAGVWDAAPLEKELLVQADKLVGGSDTVLVIDDTAVPKKGKHSVGVASQNASALGKNANCQTLVSLTLARDEVPVMVALRLFLPESWTGDLARLKRAGVPVEYRTARTKPEIALAEIDHVTAAGVRFGCVLADAGYGLSTPFRQGLTARNLAWAVGIPRHLKVYPVDARLIWPVAKRGRPRHRYIPDILSMPAEDMLTDAKWQMVSWRTGTKGKLKACFAAVRIRTADRPPQRIKDKGQQHLPGDEAWLIGELRASGKKILPCQFACCDRSAHFGCHHQGTLDLRASPSTAERGAWARPLRRAILARTSPPCAHDDARLRLPSFRRLKRATRGKKNQRTAASTKPAGRPPSWRSSPDRHPQRWPTLPKTDLREHAA